MALSLTIDQGNSSAKLVIWEGTTPVEVVSCPSVDADVINKLTERHHIGKAIFCTVTEHKDIIESVLNHGNIPYRELTAALRLPLTIDYSTPHTLGTDRIAAAVGAMSLYPGTELLVIDAGTAITYDRVSADARFAGGNIAPGIGMRLRALNSYTAKLPLVSSRGETPMWGHSTETAMRAGAVRGVAGEITYYKSLLPRDARVILTGGWGRELTQLLDIETDYQENLVNRGLNHILTYNENK